jgi:hypothetical protein
MIAMTLPQLRRHQCSVDGRTVQLTPAQANLVALLLVSHPDCWVDRETVVAALWPNPDRMPDRHYDVLKVHVCHVRRAGIPVEARFGRGRSSGPMGMFNGWRIGRAARAATTQRRAA